MNDSSRKLIPKKFKRKLCGKLCNFYLTKSPQKLIVVSYKIALTNSQISQIDRSGSCNIITQKCIKNSAFS